MNCNSLNSTTNVHSVTLLTTTSLQPLSLGLLLGIVALTRDEWLTLDGAELAVREDLLWAEFDGNHVCGLVGDFLFHFLWVLDMLK